MRVVRTILAWASVLFLCVVFVVTLKGQGGRPAPETVGFAGSYVADNGQSGDIADFDVKTNEAGYVKFTGHFTGDIEKNQCVFMSIVYLNVKIYKNGDLIFSHEQHTSGWLKYGNISWRSFTSDGITTDDTIEIEATTPYKFNSPGVYKKFINTICIGDRNVLLFWNLRRCGAGIFMAIAMASLGLIMILFVTVLKAKGENIFNGVLYGSVFTLLIGLWSLIDYDYISLFYLPMGFICILDNLLLFSQATMLAAYMNSISRGRGKKVFMTAEVLGCINVAVYMVLTLGGYIDAIIYRGMFVMGCMIMGVFCIIAAILEYDKKQNFITRTIWISAIITVTAAMAEPINVATELLPRDFIIKCAYYVFAVAQFIMGLSIVHENMDMAKRTAELEREQMESRMMIMVSQIQPHFLYNSLTAIQQLCDINAQTAKEAVTRFAKYLRGNMDSLNLTRPISFEKEMKHVENYFALEKMRFEDDINLECDIKVSAFRLPALSIQPIVENAVRYGISKKTEGGYVKISTYEDETSFVIIVEDNGVGFDTEKLKERTEKDKGHVGIENVRRRLDMMCSGTLDLISIPDKGTTVTIRLPKGENRDESFSG